MNQGKRWCPRHHDTWDPGIGRNSAGRCRQCANDDRKDKDARQKTARAGARNTRMLNPDALFDALDEAFTALLCEDKEGLGPHAAETLPKGLLPLVDEAVDATFYGGHNEDHLDDVWARAQDLKVGALDGLVNLYYTGSVHGEPYEPDKERAMNRWRSTKKKREAAVSQIERLGLRDTVKKWHTRPWPITEPYPWAGMRV